MQTLGRIVPVRQVREKRIYVVDNGGIAFGLTVTGIVVDQDLGLVWYVLPLSPDRQTVEDRIGVFHGVSTLRVHPA